LNPDRLRWLILPVLAASVGWIAWSGHVLALPMAAYFPLLWSWARTRREAAVVSMAYFLAASRGLPQGVANFYLFNIWPGLLLWLLASLSFVIVHMVFWTDAVGWRRPLRFLAACLAMAVPPLGIMGWAHPATAAGVLFAGWGWWGLFAMAVCLAGMTTRHWCIVAIIMAGFWSWSAARWAGPRVAEGWKSVELTLGAELGRDAGLQRQKELITVVRNRIEHEDQDQGRRRNTGDKMILVLPESSLGFWTPALARLWQSELVGTGVTVVAGAAAIKPAGYDNVLVRVSHLSNDVLYRQRMPVPGSMWQPWTRLIGAGSGALADFFANPVVAVEGQNVAVLMCYEQLILWPVLQSMLHDIDVVIAVGNGWWTAGTSIVDIQRASSESWARLFDKALILSFNR
jgi:Carbon-nitrogen hydrolase